MRLFTANIKSNPLMRQSRVDSDIHTAVSLGGVGFWQEIAPKRYKAALAREAQNSGHQVHAIQVECPLTLAERYWAVEKPAIAHKMHPGRVGISPTRYCVEVRTHMKQAPHHKVAFFSTHFLSGAWAQTYRPAKKWRRTSWWQHHARMVTLIAAAHHDDYTCVIGMDANRGVLTFPRLHPAQQVVVANRIDGIIVVPATGLRVQARDKRVVTGLFSDHNAVAVTATLLPEDV